jgi:ribosome-binding protein aMBF1 (putative translation factor)
MAVGFLPPDIGSKRAIGQLAAIDSSNPRPAHSPSASHYGLYAMVSAAARRWPSQMDIRLQLGAAVRRLRSRRGLTLEELAHRAGMDYTHLSGIERGRRNPSFSALVDLARALEAHPADLLKDIRIDPADGPIPRKRANPR